MCRDCGLASRSTSANICDWIQNKQRLDRKVILWRWHWRCFRSQPLSPTLLLWLWVLRWEPNNIQLAWQRKGRVTSGHRAGRELWIEGLSVRVSVKIQRHQRWEKVKQGWPRIPLSSQGYFMAQCFCSRKQAPCLWIKNSLTFQDSGQAWQSFPAFLSHKQNYLLFSSGSLLYRTYFFNLWSPTVPVV